MVLSCATTTLAQTTYQWTNLVTGAAAGSWSVAANWSPAGPAGGVDNTAQFTLPVTNSAMLTLDGSYTIGNLLFGNPSNNTIGWTLNSGTPSTSVLALSVSGGTPEIAVTNHSATLGVRLVGTQGVTKDGMGVLALNAVNTYSGQTTVNAGALVLNNLNAIAGSDSLNIAIGAVVQPDLGGTYASVPTILNGSGTANGSFGGSLDFHGGGITTVTWPGQITLNSPSATISSYGVQNNIILSGQLTGGGSLTLRPEGGNALSHTATYILSNPNNNYSGDTTMQVGQAEASATLKLGVDNGLPPTTTLHLNRIGNSGTVYFDLAGYNQVLSGITDNFNSNAVINSSSSLATLTISNTLSDTFSGFIGVPGKANWALAKQGGGKLILGGTNAYTGGTTIDAGALVLNGLITETGGLELGTNATLEVALGALGGTTNIYVNGDVTLAGQISVNDAGIVSNTAYPVIYYSGSLNTNGLTISSQTPWAFKIDTSVPHLVRLVPTQKYPLVQFTNNSFAVNTLTTNLGGILRGTPTGPVWYEVRDQTHKLWDFGAAPAISPWQITVRNLRAGTNTVTIFAQNLAGEIQSNSIELTLTLGPNTGVRPRPIPAEIWWGGISDNTGLTNYSQWRFVQKYEDGYFLHSAYWNSSLAWLLQSLAQNLLPFNTKFWTELGGDIPHPGTNSAATELNTAGGQAAFYEANGIILSEFTHDYHMENMQPVCQAHPNWPTNDDIAWWTGDLSIASTNYPYTSGIWRDVFKGYYRMFPHVKVGLTSQPEWWSWGNYPAGVSDADLAFTITNSSGQNINISLNASNIFSSFMNMAAAIGHPYFSMQSDTPWDYFSGDENNRRGTPASAATMRQMIRAYEKYFQSRGGRHTLICNVSDAAKYGTNEAAADLYYEKSSLSSLILHQQEGGRANRYLFESWYWGIPYAVVPETQPGTYTHLVMSAIKYLKGIADTNGDLEPLDLTSTATNGTVVQLKLQNNGDVQCLPDLAGQAGTVPGVTTRYFATNGVELTSTMLTPAGFCYTNLLQPGASTNLFAVTLASGISAATNDNACLEAFWNPQDPLGIVRSRVWFNAPVSPAGQWNDSDIGSPGVAGGSAVSGTNFTLLGSGGDVWGTNDALHFLWQKRTGNGAMSVHVTSQMAANAWSKAGIMIRESAAANAANVFLAVTPNHGITFQNRPGPGGLSYNTVLPGLKAPCWLRLTRSNTVFTAQCSADGANWTTLGSSNLTGFASTALWGLAVTAHDNNRGSVATFDQVALPNASLSQNQVMNGDFTGNAAMFTNWPGYVGEAGNPTNVTAWNVIAGSDSNYGVNGAGTVTSVFGPANDGGNTYLFIQGGSKGLGQNLPNLSPSTSYILSFLAAGRSGESNDTFRVVIGDQASVYVSSGNVTASNTAFQAYSYGFTTPASFSGIPSIQFYNTTSSSSRTVDFTAINIQPVTVTNQQSSLAVFLPASGNWNVSGNWSGGVVPETVYDSPDIQNGSVAKVDSSVGTCGSVYVGQGTQAPTGTVLFRPGGDLTAANILLGRDNTNYGQFNQSGGTLTVNDYVSVGDAAGGGSGASGEYNLSGGLLTAGDLVMVGNQGVGRMLVAGNSVLTTPSVLVGAGAGAAGSQMYQWGGTIYASNLLVGAAGVSNCCFTVSSGVTAWTGTLQVNDKLVLQGSQYLLQQSGVGGGLQLGAGATLEFDLDAQGVTPVFISSSKMGINATSRLVVNGTQYARWNGQPGTFTLVHHAGYSGTSQFASNNIILKGFGDLVPKVNFGSNSITLVLTASTNQTTKLGQGLLCEYWQVPITVNPGVAGRVIAAPLSALPTFTNSLVAEHPIFGRVVTNFDLTQRLRDTNYFMRFTGFLDVPTNGDYTLFLNSDDGSKLWLDGNLVVNNDGVHVAQEVSGAINLTAGMHALEVGYFQDSGSQTLGVSWAGPGFGKQAIPASALFLSSTTNVSVRQPVYQNIVQDSEAVYNYAPCFMYDEKEGLYKIWMCGHGIPGCVGGDNILYRQATSLKGLMSAPLTVALQPSLDPTKFDQIHACDPNVYRVGNVMYMAYGGNTDGSQLAATTRIGMAISYDGGRTFQRLNNGNAIISPNPIPNPNYYGVGQPAVVHAPDGYYYMIYTDINTNWNYERVIRSLDPGFSAGSFTNVTSIPLNRIEGTSVDLGFDTNLNQFVVVVDHGSGTTVAGATSAKTYCVLQYYSTNWYYVRSVTFTNPFDWSFGEGLGLLMNSQKQPVNYNQNGVSSYVFAASTVDSTNDTTLWANWVAGDLKYLVFPLNAAPKLASLTDTNLVAGSTLNLVVSATDPNVPALPLRYGLLQAPAGMTVGATTGLISWQPVLGQSPSTNTVVVQVSDHGIPPLTATQSFVVTVTTPPKPQIFNPRFSGNTFSLQVNGSAGLNYILETTTNLAVPANWKPIATNALATPPFTFIDEKTTNDHKRFYRVKLGT